MYQQYQKLNQQYPQWSLTQSQDIPTICVLCSHNCGLRVDVEGGKIVKVRPDKTNPITEGFICNKGFRISHYVNHEQRVKTPLKRNQEGSFDPITWDQAIREIGEKLNKIKKKHSAKSIAIAGLGGQANHLDVPYGLAFMNALGTPLWFNALAQEKTQHPLVEKWMMKAPLTALLHPDSENADYMLMMGTNPLISNRGHNAPAMIKSFQDSSRTLVIVDPRKSETSKKADIHLAIRPGSDSYFLMGILHELIRLNLTDQHFVKNHTKDFEKIEAIFRNVDLKEMANRCGLKSEDIQQVAHDFAKAEKACIFFDLGVEQTLFSTLIAYLIRVIITITGNLGKNGGNTFTGIFMPKSPRKFGKPTRLTVSGMEGIEMPFEMFPPNALSEEIDSNHSGRIRALIVEGSNPLRTYADTPHLQKALNKLELLVVIDPAMTETALEADYVLPVPVGYEKWENSMFPKRYPEIHLQLRPPVVPCNVDALQESEIYARLAEEMQLIKKPPRLLNALAKQALTPLGAGVFLTAMLSQATLQGGSPKQIVSRVLFWTYRALGPQLPSPVLAVIWLQCQMFALTRRNDVLRTQKDTSIWSLPSALGLTLFEKALQHPEGFEVGQLNPETNFEDHCGYRDKRVRLAPKPMLEEIQRALNSPHEPLEKGWFILNAGKRTRWNANTIQRNPAWRKKPDAIHCAVFIHPDDGNELNLTDGDLVSVKTDHNSIELPVQFDESLRRGTANMPHGFGMYYPNPETGRLEKVGVNANEITHRTNRDPFTGIPHHKYIQCQILPVAS